MKSTSRDRLLDLVGSVYDAALDETLWASVLRSLGQDMDAVSQTLTVFSPNPLRVVHNVSINEDPAFLASYNAHYLGVNPFVAPLGEAGTHVFASHEVIPDRDLKTFEFHNDWQRPQGFFYGTGIIFLKDRLPTILLNLNRNEARGPFEAGERQLLEELLPHLRRAVEFTTRLGTLTAGWNGMVALLERLSLGVVLIAEHELPAHVNSAGEQILKANRGLFVNGKGLATLRPEETKRLQRLIHDAVQTGLGLPGGAGGSMALTGGPGDAPLPVSVIPVRGARVDLAQAGRRICAAVLVNLPEIKAPVPEELLSGIFGLTPAEARLVSAMAGDQTLDEAADTFQLSRQTTRNQLKSVFQKVGVRRQSELMRRVFSLPGLWFRKG